MTLSDAHKTGRKVRLHGWSGEYYDYACLCITGENAIRDDWEVEPEVYEVEDTIIVPYNCTDFPLGKVQLRTMVGIELYDKLNGRRCSITIKPLD
jgi:hypothetical protein